MPLKIMILDDHPMVSKAYKNIIGTKFDDYLVSCFPILKEGYQSLFSKLATPDVVFIDLSMPPYPHKNINDGYDLAQIIRLKLPRVKILISTMHSSHLYLYSIIQKVNPDGFLNKADSDPSDITRALEDAISGKPYYTKTVIEAVKNISQFAFCKDELNREIVLLTAKRDTNKEISQKLKVSESTIEKRKAIIKQYLGLEKQNDRNMIEFLNNLNFFLNLWQKP